MLAKIIIQIDKILHFLIWKKSENWAATSKYCPSKNQDAASSSDHKCAGWIISGLAEFRQSAAVHVTSFPPRQ